MKRSLILAVLLAPPVFDVAATPRSGSFQTPDAVEHQRTQVRLHVEHSQLDSGVEPGFLLTVEGWEPNGHISIYLVGPKNEQVDVVSKESRLQIKQDGVASFAVPYTLRGLYAGRWQLVVAGESGIHISTIVIPFEGD